MKRSYRLQRFTFRTYVGLVPKGCLLLGMLITGCASQPDLPVEEQVGSRALQWADALMSLDYDKALTFMTPSYQNSPRSDRFRGEFSGAGFWKDAEVKWIKCDEASGPETGTDEIGTATNSSASKPVDTIAADSEEECVVTSWEPCGQTSASAATRPVTSTASTNVDSSARCEVRLILSVLKPPEMSFPMPIPYEAVWLKIDGTWYMYRQ